MRVTIDLPDDLLIEAKKRAAEDRTTLRALVERGLRCVLSGKDRPARSHRRAIRWVTVDGGLPEGLDVADRARMMDWLTRARS